jgi:hypothetical protein
MPDRFEKNRKVMARMLQKDDKDVVMQIADNFVAGASPEMVASVSPHEKITLLDGSMVELGRLPGEFAINAFNFKILHILWLFKKHPRMALAHNKKTKEVAVCLND